MPKRKKAKLSRHDPLEGAEMLRRVFPLLAGLADSGTQRDKARNRQLYYSQYAGLILIDFRKPPALLVSTH